MKIANPEPTAPVLPASFWSQNFALILNTVVSIAMGVTSYFFVTVHQQRTQELEVQLTAMGRQTDQFRAAVEAYTNQARLELESRKQNLTSAKDLHEWIGELQSDNARTVIQSSAALAVGGTSNMPVLIAMVATPGIPHVEQVAIGLRISALSNHAEVCNALCKAARVANKDVIGGVAFALGEANCTEASWLLKRLAEGSSLDGRFEKALKKLNPSVSGDQADGSGACSPS